MEANPTGEPKYVSPKGMWVSKLVLRVITIGVGISILSLAGSLSSGSVFSIIPIIMVGPPTVVSVCWAFSEAICILARPGHRGIHPGANVALDLLLWLALVALTCMVGVLGITDLTYSTLFDTYLSKKAGSSYYSLLSEAVTKGVAILALGGILTALHFTTFVIACYETNVRNRMASHTVIYVTQPYNPNAVGVQQGPMSMQPVYVQQMPQAQYHPHPVPAHQFPVQQPQMTPAFQPQTIPQYRESVAHEMDSASLPSQPTPSPIYIPPEKNVHPYAP